MNQNIYLSGKLESWNKVEEPKCSQPFGQCVSGWQSVGPLEAHQGFHITHTDGVSPLFNRQSSLKRKAGDLRVNELLVCKMKSTWFFLFALINGSHQANVLKSPRLSEWNGMGEFKNVIVIYTISYSRLDGTTLSNARPATSRIGKQIHGLSWPAPSETRHWWLFHQA